MTESEFKFGIEEEFFVSDAEKRDAARARVPEFYKAAQAELSEPVQREMLEPQVEIATPPMSDFGEARRYLAGLRQDLGEIARRHGLSIMASGTHPVAVWSRVRVNPQPRYGKVMHEMQMIGSRTVVSGMHVHVELPDPELRISVMNRLQPFLPLLLALSTSSPFWQGQRTGLMGYRLAAYREMPRTGLPDFFADAADYQRYVDTLVTARVIENASFIWWVMRPSMKHPTLELRVADSCTRLDDAIAIAALYRCLVRHLALNPGVNRGLTGASHSLIAENCWRAQRYGIHGSFVDERARVARPVGEVLTETLALLREDARALGCERELDLARWIVARGTSADQQLLVHTDALGRGLDNREALRHVVDWLSAETTGAAAMPLAA